LLRWSLANVLSWLILSHDLPNLQVLWTWELAREY
jgi:hypothetical protein